MSRPDLVARIGGLLPDLAAHDAYPDLRTAHDRCTRIAQGTILASEGVVQETIDILDRVQGREWPGYSQCWAIAEALEAWLSDQPRYCAALLDGFERRRDAANCYAA